MEVINARTIAIWTSVKYKLERMNAGCLWWGAVREMKVVQANNIFGNGMRNSGEKVPVDLSNSSCQGIVCCPEQKNVLWCALTGIKRPERESRERLIRKEWTEGGAR